MIGQNIKNYLKEHGILQRDLALETGIPASKVSRICSNYEAKIDALSYYKICKALNVSFETFLDEE